MAARLVMRASCLDRGHQEVERLIRQEPEWGEVVELAVRERLLGPVWRGLAPHSEHMPGTTAEGIRRLALVSEFRLKNLERLLHEVLAGFDAEGIPVMLLKGASLAATVHGSFIGRPMEDIDLQLRPADAQRGWRTLRDRGWTLELEGLQEFHSDFHHLPPLVAPGPRRGIVEIHRAPWPVTAPFTLAPSELWSDARLVMVDGHEVRVPSVPHQLLHLSVHLVWSNALDRGLARTARDIRAIVALDPPAWDEVVALAKRARAASSCYWALRIARTLAGADVPDTVLRELRPPGARLLGSFLERGYLASGLLRACPSLKVQELLWEAGVRPRESGHGHQRPWHVGERFQRMSGAPPAPSWRARLTAQTHSLAAWREFVALLLPLRRP